MKLAIVQFNSEWEDKPANLERAQGFVQRACEDSCDVVVFPEMFATGFSMKVDAIVDDENGEIPECLSALAKTHRISVIAGYAEKALGKTDSACDEKARNVAVAYDNRGVLVAKYAKIHPFSFIEEEKYFQAGEECVTFELNGIPSSIFICYDLRFPETFRRVAKSTWLIYVIANWPSSRQDHWEALLRARSIENQCFVVGVNRIGKDGNDLQYGGGSCVFDPQGTCLFNIGNKIEYDTVEIDPAKVEDVRSKFPFLNDL